MTQQREYPNLPVLDPDRWAWSWSQNIPRRILTDAFANEVASRQGAIANDYQNVHISVLPFLAYELDAMAWESGGTEQAQRNALIRADELNGLVGTEAAFYILIAMNRSTGYHTYRPTGAKTVKTLTGVYTRATATPAAAGQVWLDTSGDAPMLHIWPHAGDDATTIDGLRAAAVLELDASTYVQFEQHPTKTGDVYSVQVYQDAAVPGGNLTLRTHGPYTGVDLYVTPPIDREFDNDFLLYITDRAKRAWPFTLGVLTVHVLTQSEGNVYIATDALSQEWSGWPHGA